jgi:ABC-type transport system involved in multi-copper enzyme maturation permease subunit
VINLLRSEVRKVTTTKLWWGMLLGSVAFAVLGVVAQIATNGLNNNAAAPLSNPATQRNIISSAVSGYIFSAIVGIVLITTEYRHFTSRPTFLLEPRRGRVIAAKLLVAAAVGLLYGVACVAVSLAITIPWLSAKGVSIGWVANGLIVVMVGTLGVIAIFAVVGVGVGVLFRNQVAAVITTLAYLFVVEPLITVIPVVKEAYRFLPAAAGAAITGVSRNQVTLLSNWQGALVLLGWGLLFAGLGWVLTARRDIP